MAKRGFFSRIKEFFVGAPKAVEQVIPPTIHSTAPVVQPVVRAWQDAVAYSDTNTVEIAYGQIPDELQDSYAQLVAGTIDYFTLDMDNRELLASEFYDRFVIGGYSRFEMLEWMIDNGMFTYDRSWWDVYSDAYIESGA